MSFGVPACTWYLPGGWISQSRWWSAVLNDEVLPELAVPFGIKLSSLCPLSLLLEVSEVEVLSGGIGGGGGLWG